ncbi:hypothetical protein AOQ84DRAFT_7890 [Glonium stellatum]|uniref:Uncharacterized protein n=1 Tax=Glonium stellatum TaxID=574774 RepID=A0A8E2F3U7_9PEZI|nr:hypothetical protein AOQ84DRAFT_7890 [Glonium stellatum]
MKTSSLLVQFLFIYGCLAHEFFKLGSGPFQKRTTCGRGATCQQACGGGAIPCGTSGNHCYDPTLGETCCTADEHYCVKGQYCAPVVGYCCSNSETPANCASRLSFTLPPTTSTLSTVEPVTVVSTPTLVSSKPTSSSVIAVAFSSTSSSKPSSTSRVPSSSSIPLSSSAQALTTSKSASASASGISLASSTTSKASFITATTTTRALSVAAFTGAAARETAAGAVVMGAMCLLVAF